MAAADQPDAVASATTSYYGYDAHGDVRFLMDSTEMSRTPTTTMRWEQRGKHGHDAERVPVSGEALDSETGLYYMRARYYDPTVAGSSTWIR